VSVHQGKRLACGTVGEKFFDLMIVINVLVVGHDD
jgi:hypothetical protein